ncbi:MAG: hypothetical protein HQK49_11005 [Oligoflexia bacterium]|nr:hypothetical protein [Oligoflexia bacterium]
MKKFFILKSSTYILSYGLPEKEALIVKDVSAKIPVKYVNIDLGEIDNFKRVYEETVHRFCFFINTEFVNPTEINKINNILSATDKKKLILFSSNHINDLNSFFFNSVNHICDSSVVAGLENMMVKINKKLYPLLITNLPNQVFRSLKSSEISAFFKNISVNEQFNFIIQLECTGINYLGKIRIYLNTNKIINKLNNKISEKKLLDAFIEFGNQFVGIININLKKINIINRIGLPNLISVSNSSFVRNSCLYIPSIALANQSNDILIELGFINSEGKDLFSLSQIIDPNMDSEVTFL